MSWSLQGENDPLKHSVGAPPKYSAARADQQVGQIVHGKGQHRSPGPLAGKGRMRAGDLGSRDRRMMRYEGLAFEGEQGRVVVPPGGGRQSGLDADLIEKSDGVPLILRRRSAGTGRRDWPRLTWMPCLPMVIAPARSSPRACTGWGLKSSQTSISSAPALKGKPAETVRLPKRCARRRGSSAWCKGSGWPSKPQHERRCRPRLRLTKAPKDNQIADFRHLRGKDCRLANNLVAYQPGDRRDQLRSSAPRVRWGRSVACGIGQCCGHRRCSSWSDDVGLGLHGTMVQALVGDHAPLGAIGSDTRLDRCRSSPRRCARGQTPGIWVWQSGQRPSGGEPVRADQVAEALDERALARRTARVLPGADPAGQVAGVDEPQAASAPISAARISVSADVASGSVIW